MGIEFSRDYVPRAPIVSKFDRTKFHFYQETFDPYTKSIGKGSGICRRYSGPTWTDPESVAIIAADLEAGHTVYWMADDGVRQICKADLWLLGKIEERHKNEMEAWETLERVASGAQTVDEVLKEVEAKVATAPATPRRRRTVRTDE